MGLVSGGPGRDFATLLVAVHVAISWRWLWGMTKRVFGRRTSTVTEVAE